MLGLDLHVFTLKFLALTFFIFFTFSGSKKCVMQLFSVDAFFDPEKVKKRASKVAHIWHRPFYFTV
jgi:hypothetical protein